MFSPEVIVNAVGGLHYTDSQRMRDVTISTVKMETFIQSGWTRNAPDHYVYVVTFITDDGKLLKYVGEKCWWSVGKKMTVTFTVKHHIHKGRGETKILRPTVTQVQPFAENEVNAYEFISLSLKHLL